MISFYQNWRHIYINWNLSTEDQFINSLPKSESMAHIQNMAIYWTYSEHKTLTGSSYFSGRQKNLLCSPPPNKKNTQSWTICMVCEHNLRQRVHVCSWWELELYFQLGFWLIKMVFVINYWYVRVTINNSIIIKLLNFLMIKTCRFCG